LLYIKHSSQIIPAFPRTSLILPFRFPNKAEPMRLQGDREKGSS
jgi:hypothetical protein